jgi:DNA-binding transcriptional ArsR family regulator
LSVTTTLGSDERPQGLADLEALELVFRALAHQARRTILLVLHSRGGEMTSGEIAGRFEHSWPTTSRHLRVLEEAGLVRPVLRGRERVYVLDDGRLRLVAGSWVARFAEAPIRSEHGAGEHVATSPARL